MRGLTRLERHILSAWTPGVDATDEEIPVMHSLATSGRLRRVDDGDDEYAWHRTDMAYLALRVCPPEES